MVKKQSLGSRCPFCFRISTFLFHGVVMVNTVERQSVNQSVTRSVIHSVNPLVSQSVTQSVSRSVRQSDDPTGGHLVIQSVSPSSNQPVSRSISQ